MSGVNYMLVILIALACSFIWVGIAVRLVGAIFSARIRKLVAARPFLHLVWGLVALLLVAPVLRPPLSAPPEAQRLRTIRALAGLQTACRAYQTEYGLPPAGDNATIAKALRGANPRGIMFYEFASRDINSNGEAIDAWGTPYKLELQNASPPSIRSAGPNCVFGDSDDLSSPSP
jgi:hypothetical protein